jgi:hypothetical protein
MRNMNKKYRQKTYIYNTTAAIYMTAYVKECCLRETGQSYPWKELAASFSLRSGYEASMTCLGSSCAPSSHYQGAT